MPLPSWPEIPTRPLLDEFTQPESNVPPLETDFEAGMRRRRPRATVSRRLIQITIPFSGEEYDTFIDFYHRVLADGARRFTVEVPVGSGFASRTCLFNGDYVPRPMGRRWWVTMELWVFGNG